MKMVGGAETDGSRQPTYPYFFSSDFGPFILNLQKKTKNERKKGEKAIEGEGPQAN